MSSVRRIVGFVFVNLWAIAIVCALMASGRAQAQGTNGMMPDPITAQDLEDYAKRLDLSAQQRGFMQSFHEEYKTKFAELRDGDIDKFLKDNSGMQGMARLMDRKAAESSLHEYESIVSRIKTLDNAMLDQMQGMLTEAQAGKMERVRQTRERERYKAGFGRFSRLGSPAARVDLSEISEQIDLTNEEEAQVDPVIAQYESSLTSGMRKQYEGGISVVMDMVKGMEASGVNPENMQGDQRRDAFRSMESMWRNAMTKMNEFSTDLADLNMRTVKSVAPLMSQDHGRSFKQRFYERAYPEIGGRNGNTERAFDAAKQLEGLSAEQKQAIEAMATGYTAKDDGMVDQMVALANKAWESGGQNGFGGPGGGRGNRDGQGGNDEAQEARQKVRDMRQQREELAETTMAQLRAALGEDSSQRMDELMQRGARVSNGEGTYEIQLEGGGGAGGNGTIRTRVVMASPEAGAGEEETGNAGLPGPVRRREVERLSTILGMSADEKPVVLSVHDDYFERFSALREGIMKQLEDAERAKWSMDPATSQMHGPTTAQVDAAAQLRSQAMEEIHALDEGLFNDIALASGKDEHDGVIEHARMKRQREVYVKAANGSGGGMFGGQGGGPGGRRQNNRGPDRGPGRGMPDGGGNDFAEATIDVSKLADDLNLDANAQSGLKSVIAEYDTTATAALKSLFETRTAQNLAMERAMAKAMAEREKEGGDNAGGRGPGGGFGNAFRDIEGERAAARDAEKNARTLNRDSLEKFMTALPSDAGSALKNAYHLRAYPEAFSDDRSAEVQVTSVLGMNDLNDEQRRMVNDAALEYRGNYQGISEKMVKLMQEASDNDPMQNRDWAAFQQRQQSMDKLRFERNDLNDAMRSKLKVILSEEQVKRVPGMKEEE